MRGAAPLAHPVSSADARSSEAITETLRACWDQAPAAYWPPLRALLEADVLYRSRRPATGGAHAVFDDLHETGTWQTRSPLPTIDPARLPAWPRAR